MGKFFGLEKAQHFKKGFCYYFHTIYKLAVKLRMPTAEAVELLFLKSVFI